MRRIRSKFPKIGLHLVFSLLCASAAIAGCDASLGSDGDGDGTGDGDGDGGDGDGDGGGFEPCSAANPCPDGQFCFNGLCAIGCNSDGDCAGNQYCDTSLLLCQNREVPTCSGDDECAESQICVNEYCTTPPEDTNCDAFDVLEDGCESNAVCLADLDSDDPDAAACYTMPACGPDGSCPTGTSGAVCNNDFLPAKDKVCLLGQCESVSDCPADFSCVRPSENSVLGICSSGGFGSLCTENSHCDSNNCAVFPGAPIGFCQ